MNIFRCYGHCRDSKQTFVAIAVGCSGSTPQRGCDSIDVGSFDVGAGTLPPNQDLARDAIVDDFAAEESQWTDEGDARSVESCDAGGSRYVPGDAHFDRHGERCIRSREMVRHLRTVGHSNTVTVGAHGKILAVLDAVHPAVLFRLQSRADGRRCTSDRPAGSPWPKRRA